MRCKMVRVVAWLFPITIILQYVQSIWSAQCTCLSIAVHHGNTCLMNSGFQRLGSAAAALMNEDEQD